MTDRIPFQAKILLAVLICASTCFPQARQRTQQPKQTRPGAPFLQQAKTYEESPYVTKVVFRNGMTVLVNEFRAQPVASIQLYVHAGSFDDPPQMPGTAQLVAAMVHRGGIDKSSGTFRQNVQALGGILRSETCYGTTLFEIVAPSNQWKRALGIQADAVLGASFDLEGMKLEARLAQGEAQAILDDPEESAREQLLELAFNQPKMASSTAIKNGALAKITAETVAAFYKKNYTPANMMLVVSGDLGSSEVLNEAARIYSKLPAGQAKTASLSMASAQDEFRYRGINEDVSIPQIFFGFHAVPESSEDYKALEVLRSVLGMGESSVIPLRLRHQKKLIVSSEAQLSAYPGFGYFGIMMRANPADIDRSELALLTEIELLKREDLTDAEMERALAQIETSYWRSQQTVSGKAGLLARFEYAGSWKDMDRYIAELRRVKAADVRRVAAKYFRLENCSLLEYLPASIRDRNLTAEAFVRTFEALLKSSADQESAERSKKTVLAVKFSPAGAFKFSEIQYPLQTASILRGPNLFIREDHTNPLLEMGLFFPGGKLDESKENAGITKLMTGLMLRGTADFSQSYRQFETYGGQIQPVLTDDYFGIYVSVLSQNFEEAFKLLIEMIKAPNFDKDVVQRQKEIQTAEILARRNSDAYPGELLDTVLFPGFPYAQDCDGTEASVAAITPESLSNWYDMHVKDRKPVVTVIGDTKGTSLASVFVKNFSGSRMQETKIPEAFSKALEKGETLEQGWNKSESLILFGFQAPPEDDEDGYAVSVLGGYIGNPGRLSQELRDRLGLAHEVSVTYKPRLRGGSFVIRAATTPESEETAIKALRGQIQQMKENPIQYRDFRSAVNEAVGAHTIAQQDRFAQIRGITENVLAGKGIDGYQNYTAGLQDVKQEDLKSVMQRILNMDRAAVLRLKGKQ